MSKRIKIDILAMYDALICLGHKCLWLREISGQRFLITWDNLTVAHYDPKQKSWSLRKHADVVNDNPSGKCPSGAGLTELTDGGMVFTFMGQEVFK